MKKTVILLIAIILLAICLASCERVGNEHEHTFEYVVHEIGHFKQYTCGCASPDILEEHYDHEGKNHTCDACGYYMGHQGVAFYYVATDEGHCAHTVGETCDGTCIKSPHKNFDADLLCDVCGYAMNSAHNHICEYTPCGDVGHFVSYSCGCASPEGTYYHYDNDNNNLCDACSYQIVEEANHFIRKQAGAEWLGEISADDITEIKMISGGGGPLPPVSFTHILSSMDEAVISDIFEAYYWLDSKPVSEEETQIPDGGYVIVEFILHDGSIKKLYFINGDFYYDGNGNYFEVVRLPMFRDGTNFENFYGFEVWDQYCGLYHSNGLAAALIFVSELEFVELTDDIELGDFSASYYIEMNGEKIFFLNEYYFYIGNDRSTYYQLVGKTLDELIDENGLFYN